jgi:porphobilinogen synthase
MMSQRPRRLRRSALLREAVAETRLSLSDLIQPHFVLADARRSEPIDALPGIARQGIEALLPTVEADLERGIRQVLLFGLPARKERRGSGGAAADGPTSVALRRLRAAFGKDLLLAADVCLCPYTDTATAASSAATRSTTTRRCRCSRAGAGVRARRRRRRRAVRHDGRSRRRDPHGARRRGFGGTAILSYSVKYASSYYGPFREAAHSAPAFGDRRSHQMDPRNRREALREIALDEAEGADMVMVKPALAYLDVIAAARAATALPVAAYNVSGEYSAVKLLAKAGLADERAMVLENLGAIRRAGADLILTYHARDAAREGWIKSDRIP